MHRASTILSSARLDKELVLPEISQKTKIPLKYLQAIESEDITSLPDEPYCSLIVKDYADFLGLNGQNILSLFRRDVLTKKKNHSPASRPLSFTPQFAFMLTLVLSFLAFGGYLLSEYIKFNRPPHLEVNWPNQVTNSTLEISGITDPEATVRVNDSLVIVYSDGHFIKKLNFSTDKPQIVVQSISRGGQTAVAQKVY